MLTPRFRRSGRPGVHVHSRPCRAERKPGDRSRRRGAGAPSAPAALACVILLLAAPGARGQAEPPPSASDRPPPAGRAEPERAGEDGAPRLTVTRLQYEGGGDWYANPSSLPNLLAAIRERTGLQVAERPATARPSDPDLPDHPYLYVTGHGNIRFSERDIEALRAHLSSGGFLHVDDNYGLDESFRREVRRLFPDRDLVEVPLDHPVYHVRYDLPGLPKVHEHDGLPARGLGIFIDGRLALFYSYQSDLGDGWEDPDVHGDPPEVREAALRMGVNLFLHALGSTPAAR